jgi:hypothetical protein
MSIHIGPGLVYTAPLPRCPTHGAMSPGRSPSGGYDRWECHGYDGEGCPHTVLPVDLDWQLTGHHGVLGPPADGRHAT